MAVTAALLGIIPVLVVLAVVIAAPIFLMLALGFRGQYDDNVITWVFGVAFLCVVAAVVAAAHVAGTWIIQWWIT